MYLSWLYTSGLHIGRRISSVCQLLIKNILANTIFEFKNVSSRNGSWFVDPATGGPLVFGLVFSGVAEQWFYNSLIMRQTYFHFYPRSHYKILVCLIVVLFWNNFAFQPSRNCFQQTAAPTWWPTSFRGRSWASSFSGTTLKAFRSDILAPVWPDLAKFRHFGIILKNIWRNFATLASF